MWHTLWNVMAIVGIGTTVIFVILFIVFLCSTHTDPHKKPKLNSYLNGKDDAE